MTRAPHLVEIAAGLRDPACRVALAAAANLTPRPLYHQIRDTASFLKAAA